ncbi:phosphatidylinositol-glycan biosynthesis class X protein [Canna indica]|uniref:Phosphatidylinositol-glycan biosynthesis class X protein n=1 Tax=Canna indica TaxID=4628 RepID=A0AAQ3QRQ3_9LILI|nr:phosphatidylinositol-glycan biosynthesis class X protein [Canna indica]
MDYERHRLDCLRFFQAPSRTTAGLSAQKFVVFCLAFFASALVKVNSYDQSVYHVLNSSQRVIGCSSCFQTYLASSYFLQHHVLLDFQDYLAQEFGTSDFCKESTSKVVKLGLSTLQRQLSGEGSHRRLISTLSFMNLSESGSLLDQYCEAVVIERLPIGVFADPFELQHLVHRKAFIDAAVFGDTNLELPSALSNKSIAEIHLRIGHESPMKGSETIIELPLHARCPPLNESGYAEVRFELPDLFLRCRPKILHSEPCSWTLIELDARPAKTVLWYIPAGNNAHKDVVSNFTFVSALVCALSIVVFALSFSRYNDPKRSS